MCTILATHLSPAPEADGTPLSRVLYLGAATHARAAVRVNSSQSRHVVVQAPRSFLVVDQRVLYDRVEAARWCAVKKFSEVRGRRGHLAAWATVIRLPFLVRLTL